MATTDAPEPTDPATSPPTTPATTAIFDRDPFTLGVASGDPDATSVVLWTRLAPDPLAGGGVPADSVEVTWEISGTSGFDTVDAGGSVTAEAALGHSVHVVATLEPGRWYYRFRVGDFVSPVGITRTAPSAGTAVPQVRFASASCQNYEDGHYIAHRDIAEQQPDFLVWLGDYIYEGAAGEIGVDGNVRTHGTPEPTTLSAYRDRYALYRSDPDLQASHAACPWFVIWDDHEVENNHAGLVPQDVADQPTFAARRRDAYQAWWEHRPVRLDPPAADAATEFRIYRSADWGDLVHLALLDTRQYRSDQSCGAPELSLDPPCPETFEPDRTLLGAEQEQWLFDTLDAHTATQRWRAIGQQVVMSDLTLGGAVLNYDQWDGYPAQRSRVVDHLAERQIPDVVVLTGDIHLAGTGTIRAGERGVGAPVAVEFVATSVSSGGRVDPVVADLVNSFPDIFDVELEHRGYILHTVTPDEWRAEYRMIETVKERESPVFVHSTYAVDRGTNTVRFAS